MSIEVTNLDQLEVGTVVEQKSSENETTTHWVITDIVTAPIVRNQIAVYGERVRKSDHQVIKRASNGLPTYSGILVWFIAGELRNPWYSLVVIESKQPVEQPEEEERLSICCGADEDENIENMCSACHESTTFEVPHRNLDGSLGEMPPEPETPLLDDNFLPIPENRPTPPSPVKFETVVHSNMVQLIGELSSAVAYLEDMNISNEDTGLIDQSEGLRKAIRNAKNIASALRQDAIDRKEINVA